MNHTDTAALLHLAAKRIQTGESWLSCNAIRCASGYSDGGASITRTYGRVFTPFPYGFWLADLAPRMEDDELRDLRILMLCMAASLAEAGDLEAVAESSWKVEMDSNDLRDFGKRPIRQADRRFTDYVA